MNRHGIKSASGLIRDALMTKIGVDVANAKKNRGLPDEYMTVCHFVKAHKNKLGKDTDAARDLEIFFKNWKKDYLKRHVSETNKKLDEIRDDAEVFLLVKKGRPRGPKRSRGKPRDTGTDINKRTLS